MNLFPPHPFFTFLKERLNEDSLPGTEAQMKMAPGPVGKNPHQRITQAPKDAHLSGVLVLLFEDQQKKPEVVLTLRTPNIHHGGQLSFPGGRAEGGETPQETALRETQEEIGIAPETITVIGKLSPLYVEVSHHQIVPVVGFMDRAPAFNPFPGEVEEVFSVSLETLLDEKRMKQENWNLHHLPFSVPFWKVHRVPLWGATAMILSELLTLYRNFKNF